MYQTSTGCHNHRSHRDDGYELPEGVRLVTDYFRDRGYFVSRGQANDLSKPGKLDYNFKKDFHEAYDGTDWRQKDSDQPFFAHVHFSETHRTFYRDPERPIDPARVDVPPYYPDHPVTRLDWALYLETIQNLDRKVGRILARLEEDKLLDSTIIFFTGDHGRPMPRGKQWLYEGGIRVPMIVWGPGEIPGGAVRKDLISSIDWAPTWLALAGIDVPGNMQGADLFGKAANQREYVFAARDRCDETVDRIRCVRTDRFKYIRNFYPERPYTQFNAYKKRQYPTVTLMEILHAEGKLTPEQELFMVSTRPVEELYDLQEDPHEVRNLAGDRQYRSELVRLRDRLDQWIWETRDRGQIPEDPAIAAFWKKDSEQYHAQGMSSRGLPADISPEDYLAWWEERLK
jgi:uncharacterized sulfatase